MSSDEGKKLDADNKNAETDKKSNSKKKQSRKKKKAAKKAEAKKAGVKYALAEDIEAEAKGAERAQEGTESGENEKDGQTAINAVQEAAVEDLNGNLEYYAVRFVVEERKNQNPILAEANVLGKLYGANAKKIGSLILGSLPKSNVARIYTQPIKHSISEFLQSVKTLPLTNEVS